MLLDTSRRGDIGNILPNPFIYAEGKRADQLGPRRDYAIPVALVPEELESTGLPVAPCFTSKKDKYGTTPGARRDCVLSIPKTTSTNTTGLLTSQLLKPCP